jgi:hypothetical protein
MSVVAWSILFGEQNICVHRSVEMIKRPFKFALRATFREVVRRMFLSG